ncbi:Holliday junction DNA helicase subunit RuvA [Marininema mesophilum]|uniref:Holliday junction branch migration complex subunit RuvA n=1 Tax=Marininema mesophilum TaxID=1048340 RepID=A0A1H2SAQ7_9BACL|nr:Holliday junction branch migration protein RuvA [Marininema mesophilum]SDW28672.1 Holliday junction DNA helicase subunit RuvA [Marininema mesophilum]
MIDYIRGQIAYHSLDAVVVEAAGVGYRIFCPHPFHWQEGETAQVFTHHVVREDSQSLYGFKTFDERDLFRLLLEVSGIGPKVALAAIGSGSPTALVEAVQREDLHFLTKLPGVGKKTAQRLILDLKDKLEKAGWSSLITGAKGVESNPGGMKSVVSQEAIDALMALGYNEAEAETAVHLAGESFEEENPSVDDWIRKALQVSMKA